MLAVRLIYSPTSFHLKYTGQPELLFVDFLFFCFMDPLSKMDEWVGGGGFLIPPLSQKELFDI